MAEPLLFVSHVAEDRAAATELVSELERRGIGCWIAPRDVRPGEAFDDAIAEGIEGARAMLLVFSDRCNDSVYIRREITVAGEAQKLVIPLRIEDAQPKKGLRIRLADLHWIDAFAAREQAIDAVVRSIGGKGVYAAVAQPPPVVHPVSAPAAAPSPPPPPPPPVDGRRAAGSTAPFADPASRDTLPPGPANAPVSAAAPAVGAATGADPESIDEVGTGTDPHEAALLALTEEDVPTDQWSEDDRALLKRARRNDRDAQHDLGFRYRHADLPADKRRAAAWMLRAACQGRVGAMSMIGYFYALGEGVPRSERRSYLWYRKEAEKGYAPAQHSLGIHLLQGKGVKRDFAEAAAWLRKAVDGGYRPAGEELGELYEDGRGVERNPAESMRLYRRVLTLGQAGRSKRVSYLIGRLYEQGLGVPQDFQQAVEWYRKAQGYFEADAAVSRLKRDYGVVPVGGVYDGELQALADGEFSTEHWPEQARTTLANARTGDPSAQWSIGKLFLDGGVGISLDWARAAAWLFKAASGGHLEAQCDLAELFRQGKGVVQDSQEAFRWEMKAAEQGHPPSQYLVGRALEYGAGINPKEDPFEAAEWYRKAAEQGFREAQEALGRLYEHGKGVGKDPDQAAAWYREAFANGSMAAATSLGRLYENGDGAYRNYQQAADWYARSSEDGAKQALARLKSKHGVIPVHDQTGAA